MKYIIIYAKGFNDKIIVVDEPITYDNQDRMSFFNEFYFEIFKNEYLPLLNQKELDLLTLKTNSFLKDSYRKIVTKDITERHHKVTKIFLGIEYELFIVEDRLAILGIDLYNINIYALQNNISIEYKTFETKYEMSRSDIWY
jgi:hypothetical protein